MSRDYSAIQRVLIISFVLNLAAAAAKLTAGVVTGALSLVADGIDTLFDSAANVIGLLATRIGRQPPDEDHPYGHRKFETVAALLIATLLFVAAWELLSDAAGRLMEPRPPEVTLWSVGVLIASGALQGATGVWELRRGRALQSEILIADGRHALTSLFISLGVLIGLGLVWLGVWWADALTGALVALVITRIGVQTIRENIPALVDRAALEPDAIGDVVAAVEGVESFHRIRSRGTLDNIQIDLHVRVAPHLSMQAGNAIGDEVRRRLLALPHVEDVTVHIEAARGPDSAADLYAGVQQTAQELGMLIHEFWIYSVDAEQTLHLHVGVAPTLLLAEAHALVDELEQRVLERFAALTYIHTHIELATVDVLPGARVSHGLQQQIEQAVQLAVATIPDVSDAHEITVRQVEGQLFITLEALVDGRLFISHAHQRSDDLAQAIRATVPNVGEVIVHLEPHNVADVEPTDA